MRPVRHWSFKIFDIAQNISAKPREKPSVKDMLIHAPIHATDSPLIYDSITPTCDILSGFASLKSIH